jgi:predicted glutamine amidotransferase
MCVIIVKPKDKTISGKTLRRANANNPHGWGVLAKTKQGLLVEKGWTTSALADFCKKHMNEELIIHARIATSGKRDLENAHPFVIAKGTYLFHNGIFNATLVPLTDKTRSDTRTLAEDILAPIFTQYANVNLLAQEDMQKWLADFCKSSNYPNKLVLVNKKTTLIVRDELGKWRDGVWYSNESAFTFKSVRAYNSACTTLAHYAQPYAGMGYLDDTNYFGAQARAARCKHGVHKRFQCARCNHERVEEATAFAKAHSTPDAKARLECVHGRKISGTCFQCGRGDGTRGASDVVHQTVAKLTTTKEQGVARPVTLTEQGDDERVRAAFAAGNLAHSHGKCGACAFTSVLGGGLCLSHARKEAEACNVCAWAKQCNNTCTAHGKDYRLSVAQRARADGFAKLLDERDAKDAELIANARSERKKEKRARKIATATNDSTQRKLTEAMRMRRLAAQAETNASHGRFWFVGMAPSDVHFVLRSRHGDATAQQYMRAIEKGKLNA